MIYNLSYEFSELFAMHIKPYLLSFDKYEIICVFQKKLLKDLRMWSTSSL